MRKIFALALLLIPALAVAGEPIRWTRNDLVGHYMACREAGGTTTRCACAVQKLVEIQPDPEKLTGDNIAEAVKACVLPPNTENTTSI